jgi:CubicO group peptidase (beta-lactamase class C family)
VGKYLGELKRSHPDKAAIRVRDLLTHRAGFIPFIPFFLKIKDGDYSSKPSSHYPVKVAEGFYLTRDYYKKVMWKRMLESPLKTPGKYVYSDISMFMMKEILERIVRKPLDVYVNEQFYKPLGACSIGFCPLDRFAEERIVPTEGDTYFRKQQLKGYVQDPGAAMAGGVSGHAGLFATAYDLAILSQMLLNGGSYNGRQYIKPETVKKFSSRQSKDSRRGLGFDCWDPESEEGYPCQLASPETFGHTGFTGTCVWIDPEHRLVYIFLSNRLYPSPDKNKLMKLNIRPRIHDVIYEAMGTGAGRITAVDP